jgi:hypothetical protein
MLFSTDCLMYKNILHKTLHAVGFRTFHYKPATQYKSKAGNGCINVTLRRFCLTIVTVEKQ